MTHVGQHQDSRVRQAEAPVYVQAHLAQLRSFGRLVEVDGTGHGYDTRPPQRTTRAVALPKESHMREAMLLWDSPDLALRPTTPWHGYSVGVDDSGCDTDAERAAQVRQIVGLAGTHAV